jgi:hypothetical protein
MPAGTKITGRDGIIELTKGSVIEEIPCLLSWTLTGEASFTEDGEVCMLSNGDGGSSFAAAGTSVDLQSTKYSLSTEHYWQESDLTGATALVDITDIGTKVNFKLYPHMKTTGKVLYSGVAAISNVSIPSSAGEKIKQTIEFVVDGNLTRTIVP